MIVDPIVSVFLSIILTIVTIFFGAFTKINVYSYSNEANCISNLKSFVNTGIIYGKEYTIKKSYYPLNNCCIIVKDKTSNRVMYYCVERNR